MDKVTTLHFMPDMAGSTGSSAQAAEAVGAGRPEPSAIEVLGALGGRRPNGDGSEDLEQILAENKRLQRFLDAYQAALDRHAIVAVTDPRGKIAFVNNRFCSVSGYASWELLGRSHSIVNSGHHPKDFFVRMWQTIARGEIWHGEICNRKKSGEIYWVDTTIVPFLDRQKRVDGYISIRYDITKRKVAEEALEQEVLRRRKAEALLLDVIETVPDGIAAFDADDRLIVHNQAYRDCYDKSREAIQIGATFESIVRCGLENGQYALPDDLPETSQSWLEARLRDHSSPGNKSTLALAGGRWLQAHERRSSSGNTIGTRTDITELKRREAAIKHHAEHDSLTGLFNRSVLNERLMKTVADSVESGTDGVLVVADLDGFKQINDTMGHAAGDALLVAVARRLESVLRKSATIIRLGGDEFAIILPHAARSVIDRIAGRILTAVEQPLSGQKQVIKPRLSMGISIFPRDGRKTESLLKKADLALYQCKAEARGHYRIFSRAVYARDANERKLAAALAKAVASSQIDVALQPQFLLSDSSHSGFEALARWRLAGQSISPAEFVPIAEERGLIIEMGQQVLQKSLKAICLMKKNGLNTGRVAVNVAAAQIRMREFPAMLKATVIKFGLTPDDLEVELTENILLDKDHDQIAHSLRQLRQSGFSIALDDFGTGYASLAHLSRFPISKIKIDRTFIKDMLTKQGASTIVRAMIGLAHNLGMQVVAEGIETPEQYAELRSMNCDFGQGYLISRPLAVEEGPEFPEAKALIAFSPRRVLAPCRRVP